MDLDQLPPAFSGPSAWTGREMRDSTDWVFTLTEDQVDEIEFASHRFLSMGGDPGEIGAEDFPLPRLSGHLAQLRETLLHGCGFEVIRGLPVAGYDQRLAATIFCGVGAHLGKARSQNAQGHVLGHVRDLGANPDDPNSRIYQTRARQTFHTDSTDVVGLLCLREAREGGDSLLVSAEAIYNRMLEERPDLLALLFDPVATDRRGEVPEGMKPYTEIPPLSWHEGHLTVYYQRQYIDSASRFPDAMPLTPEHVEALDMFDRLANDPHLHLSMRLRPGDMQFVYNHGQLHDRTGFLDWPGPERRRHLLRLWLSIPGDRPLPPVFAQRYGSITIGDRGGIVTPETRLHAPIDV